MLTSDVAPGKQMSPFSWLGGKLAAILTRQRHSHGPHLVHSEAILHAVLQPGDVLLVESNSRVGSIIKHLTQSTWSHAALYVGHHVADAGDNPAHCFIEADIVEGVRSVGLDEFSGMHTRICRPFGLSETDCTRVANFAISRIGNRYDLRNIFDLLRYFLPAPPISRHTRRRLLAFGSGEPTRAICSTLIAQALQSIRYPILPAVESRRSQRPDCPGCLEEVYRIRHHSLFTPRDFDVSPYFRIINPNARENFDFRSLAWEDEPSRP